ncbi:MAG: hypothetical protein NE328_11605 [Lentisphaeraceae bacterium]|nr:hypothetical protein [Lentisphaeraceae bacterium]
MKYFLILLMALIPLVQGETKKEDGVKKAAKIEIVLRQQRELEADELMLIGKKSLKEGRYEEAINKYKKAISLYEKSSASEKRVTTKIAQSRTLLVDTYKTYAGKVIKEAEKESSVELYNKAEKLLSEAKAVNDQLRKSR